MSAEKIAAVGPMESGQRLDRWLSFRFPDYSRTQLQHWIRQGRVEVDGASARPSLILTEGQSVRLVVPDPEPSTLQPADFPLNVLYEDDHLLVVLKQAGLQVHPGAGPPRVTLAHALLHRYPGWDPPGSADRPGIVHRLDRDTSGLLLVARSSLAYRRLSRQIVAREVTRRYVALVWGVPELDSGQVIQPIGRDPRDRRRMAVLRSGREASTYWRVLHRFDTVSLLDIVLGTGRTHQIRVHLSHVGHPVFGDPVYGGTRVALARVEAGARPGLARGLRRLNRQALHAYHLTFRHPADGRELRFEAPVPADMEEILQGLTASEGAA